MKSPRVEDFDPKATQYLKSSLDDMPPILPPSARSIPNAETVSTDVQPTDSQEPVKPALREPGKPEKRESVKPGSRESVNPGNESINAGPDFSYPTLRKETFMFTDHESDQLEDVKIDI